MANVQILDQNIGMVSAYAYAVSKGYQGTEEQFAEELANVGINISEIREAIDTFNNVTVPAAIDAIVAKGTEQVDAVASEGSDQVSAITTAGADQLSAITARGSQILTGIETAGGLQIEAITEEGSDQVAAVTAKGEEQVAAVTEEGETQVAAVESAGETQTGNVNTAGATQVSAVETKGAETLASIPEDYSKMGYLQELLHDEVADTVQTYTFDGGAVSQILHKRSNTTIRTDAFTYGNGTITETRTLSGGQSVTIETDLDTLETAVTYTE